MIYKVLYQDSLYEAPVRERTKSLFMEANSEKDVRKKMIDRNVNIEFIQALNEAHLAYEKKSQNFILENS